MIYKGIISTKGLENLPKYSIAQIYFVSYDIKEADRFAMQWRENVQSGYQGEDVMHIENIGITFCYVNGERHYHINIFAYPERDVTFEEIERYFQYGVLPKKGE